MALLVCLAACAGDDRRAVRLERVVPEAGPDCGAPPDARTLVITALGEFPATEATARSIDIGAGAPAEISIEGFPPATISLALEVRGFGGAVRAIGRTPEFALDQLDDGAVVPVFMAPVDGFCPTGPPAHARDAPLVARAGRGVLVAGGAGQGGEPIHEVELYDPAAGRFAGLGEPLYGVDLAAGLAGASMTALPGERVVVAGGGATAFQIYDAAAAEFGAAQFLREARAHHTAVALDEDRLFLAGGCARLDGAACAAETGLATSVILTVSSGRLDDGPRLQQIRIGGRVVREADGRVLLIGGVDAAGAPLTEAERVDPDGGAAGELVAGTGAAAALLPAGGILTGFAPLGAPASQSAAVVPPGAAHATMVADVEPLAGPTLAALEDGRVLVVGGGRGKSGDVAAAAVYEPASATFQALPTGPDGPDRSGAAALSLEDGSVLLIGGRDAAGSPFGDAWIFRPRLVGPWSGGRAATFATPESASAMVPRDPGRARIVAADGAVPAHYWIEASRAGEIPSEWAVMAGPRFTSLSLEAIIAAEGGGAAILLWFRDDSAMAVLSLTPGRSARLSSVEAGAARPLGSCTGESIGAGDLAAAGGAGHQLAIAASGGKLEAKLDGSEILRCDVAPPAAGLVGVAPLGDEGSAVRLDLISVSR